MGDKELPCQIRSELETLSDAELASLIIEYIEPAEVGLALAGETYRRLKAPRARAAERPIPAGLSLISN